MRSRITSAVVVLLALALLAVPGAIWADSHEEMAEGETSNGFVTDLTADLDRTGQKLVALAEAIPADAYGWRPAEGVRSVSEVFMHVVAANTLLVPAIGGAPPEGLEIPENPFELARKWEAEITAKDDVVAKLKESLAYASGALGGMDPATFDDELQLFGPMSRRAYMMIVLTHNHEHLGQAIAYARANDVVPPWSQPPPATEATPAEEGEGDGSYEDGR